MSVTVKRRVTRVSLAIDILLLIALVVGDTFFRGSRNWSAGFAAIAFCVVSIAAGLLYLRSTRGRS